MIVRELINLIGFKVDDKQLKGLDKQLKSVQNAALAIGAAFSASAAALGAFVYQTAKAGDAAAKGAQQYGVSIKALQELEYAASQSGMQSAELTTGLRFLNRFLNEAGNGAKRNAEILGKLGVSAKDSSGKLRPVEDVLGDIAESFSKMPDGVQKSAFSLDLFSRSGSKFIPLLNAGRQGIDDLRQRAVALGIVLDDETAKASEVLLDNLDDLKNIFIGLRNSISKDLIPIMVELQNKILAWYLANQSVIKQKLGSIVNALVKAFSAFASMLGFFYSAVKRVVSALGGLENALRLVGLALAVIAAMRLVSLFGAISSAVIGLAMAYRTLGLWALFANVGAALLPVLIGALIVAIGLLIEDFYVAMQGGDSMTGRLIESFKLLTETAQKELKLVGMALALALSLFLGPAGMIATLVAVMAVAIHDIYMNWDSYKAQFLMLWDDIKYGVQNIINSMVGYIAEKIDWIIESVKSIPSKIGGKFLSFLNFASEGTAGVGSSPASSPATSSSTANYNTSSTRINVQVPLSYNAAGSGNPEDVARVVGDVLEARLNETLQNYPAGG